MGYAKGSPISRASSGPEAQSRPKGGWSGEGIGGATKQYYLKRPSHSKGGQLAAFFDFCQSPISAVRKGRNRPLTWYSEFVLGQFDSADDRQAFYRMSEADVDAAMQILGGDDEADVLHVP